MPILTPTKATGGTAKANDVVYVEPAQTVTDQDLVDQLSADGLNAAFVADFLSACLTHERCGSHLYRSVSGRTNNPVLKRTYVQFGNETLHHVEVLEEAITAMGGNPAYVSPLARAVEAADAKALEATFAAVGGIDPMAQEMSMLDAVFMAETVDHANWKAIGQLAGKLGKGRARDTLAAAAQEVEAQEDEHLGWAQDTRARLTMAQASSSLVVKAGTKAEELVAQVKGWLGDGSTASVRAPKPAGRAGTAKAPAKKAQATKGRTAAKKPAGAKKASAKKAGAKKAGAKKAAARKAPAKKTAAKKTAIKTTAATKRSAGAKKATGKKSAAKKALAKKAPAKKRSGRWR